MAKKDETAPVKAVVRDPKGGLPRKKRKPPTTGTRTGKDGRPERYSPSARLKSAHRKNRKAGATMSLRAFAEGRPETSDWLANKKSTGS